MDSSRYPLIAVTSRFGELCSPFSFTGVCDGRCVRVVGFAGWFLDLVEEVMMSRLWLCLLLVLPLWASAAVGDLVIPKYRQSITTNGVTTYYYKVEDYCAGYLASIGATTWTCSAMSSVTSTTQSSQTWNYSVTPPGGSTSARSTSGLAWCDPAYYVGPAAYNSADTSKVWCKVVNDPPPMCPPGKVGVYTWGITMDANGHVISGPPLTGSDGQCEIKITGVRYCYQATDGSAYCRYDTVTTGNIRTPSLPDVPPPNSSPPADSGNTAGTVRSNPMPGDQSSGSCPKGTVNAGVDSGGIPICMGTGYDRPSTTTPTTTTTSAPTTTNNSDGSTTTTQNTTTTNSDGTTTTVTTTVIKQPDGSTSQSQTSSTSTRPDGTVGVSGSSADKNNLCAQNPNLTICQNSTVSGKCGDISCTGDAIQCATLRAAAAMQCQQQKDIDDLTASPSKSLGDAILNGADPSKSTIDTLIKGDAVDMSSPTLDQGGFVGVGSCLPDKTFTVMGHAVTVSFATVCSNVQPLRYIVMACAFILVYLMVARAVING